MVEVVRCRRRWVRVWADQAPSPISADVEVLSRRRVIERTFGWLGRQWRLGKDHKALSATSEAWMFVAMTRLMLRRLAARLSSDTL
jgi:transposase